MGNASSDKWLDRAIVLLLLLGCAVVLSKNYADPDLWGHVQYGQDLLRDGLPDAATYTYTAAGHRWINHENLSELIFGWGVETISCEGLLLLKCLLGVGVLGLITWRARAQYDAALLPLCIVVSLVSANLMYFWVIRPQVFSYAIFALLIVLLARGLAGWEGHWHLPWPAPQAARMAPAARPSLAELSGRVRWLWMAPLLFAVWANTHGAFVAGYFLLAAYLACRGGELLVCHGRRGLPLVMHLAAIGVVTGAATLLNPYGWELHRWLLAALRIPRPEIIEWRPPELWAIAWIPWWALVVLFLAALATSRKPRDFTHIVLLALTLWQSLEHRRHIPFFAIIFGFWMFPHVQSAAWRMGVGRDRTPLPVSPSWRSRLALASLLSVALAYVGTSLFFQLRECPVRRDDYPVSAFQYIANQRLKGKLVVRFKWAQYAIAAFGRDGIQVAFDGRFRTCYPQEIVDMYFDYAVGNDAEEPRQRSPSSPPFSGQRLLEFGEPDLVLIDRQQQHTVKMIGQQQEQWVLLYQDSLAQLWGRAVKYDDPASPDFLPPSKRCVGQEPQRGMVRWPALPVPNESAITRLAGTPVAKRNGEEP